MKALQFWSFLGVLVFLFLLILGFYLIDRWTKK